MLGEGFLHIPAEPAAHETVLVLRDPGRPRRGRYPRTEGWGYRVLPYRGPSRERTEGDLQEVTQVLFPALPVDAVPGLQHGWNVLHAVYPVPDDEYGRDQFEVEHERRSGLFLYFFVFFVS